MIKPASGLPSYDYIPGLDGLRACAVILVLIAHCGFSPMIPGGFGVTLFFFISGMLITRLLLAEHINTGTISVWRFYMRRLLRLYPALLVTIITGTVIFYLAGGAFNWAKMQAALLYYINFYGIVHGFGQSRTGFDPFSVLWSLAIEQQFYIFFPLLVLPFIRRYKQLLLTIVIVLVAVLAWRTLLHFQGASSDLIYMRTDTRIDSILYGALLSLVLMTSMRSSWIRFASRPIVLIFAVTMIVSMLFMRNPHLRDTLSFSLQGIALMPIVTVICFSPSNMGLTRFLEIASLRRVGTWSYSLYLLHPVAIVIAEIIWGSGSLGIAQVGTSAFIGFFMTAIPLSFILAAASYYWIEKPAMQWRHLFGSRIINKSS
jgi:peptidoglycan/LPS O-acetylase OafA/YrhL